MARCKFCRKAVVWKEVFVNDELVWRAFDRKPARNSGVPLFAMHNCEGVSKSHAETARCSKNIPDDPWWNR